MYSGESLYLPFIRVIIIQFASSLMRIGNSMIIKPG